MKQRCGMSLVEIAIGVIILALILLPSLNVITSGTRSVVATRDHLQAVFVAQQMMEKTRIYPFKFLDEDHKGLTAAEKAKTLEAVMRDNPASHTLKINDVNYNITDFSIAEVENIKDPTLKSMALVSFKILYKPRGKTKDNELEIHTAISQQE